jgi:hypothetical protein
MNNGDTAMPDAAATTTASSHARLELASTNYFSEDDYERFSSERISSCFPFCENF